MNDKISVILPCYNSEKYIEKCIESILNQTYQNIEIIIIDDGSTDHTLKILEKYKKENDKISIIKKKNTGVSDSRNIGIKEAKGKYIMFVDSDDFLELDAIEKLYLNIKKYKANIVRGRYKRIRLKEQFIEDEISVYNGKGINEIIYNILNGNIPCYVWLLIINKEILLKYDIQFDKKLKIMEDTLFYIQLIEKENIYFCDDIIYNYVENINSATGNIRNTLTTYKEMLNAEEKIVEELKKNNLWNDKLKEVAIKKIVINGICNCTWKLYKSKNIDLFNQYLSFIDSNDQIKKLITSIKLTKLRLDKKLVIYLIIKRKFKTLQIFYRVKSIIIRILRGE